MRKTNEDISVIILSAYLTPEDFEDVTKNEMLFYEFVSKKDPNWHFNLKYTLRKSVRKLKERIFEPEVLWYRRSVAKSYWILQLSNFENEVERKIFFELSVFSQTYARGEAKVFVTSDGLPYHKEIDTYFGNAIVPKLIISSTPSFEEYLLCKHDLLENLLEERNGFVNFLREIHFRLVVGVPFETIINDLSKSEMWSKIVKNAPGFVKNASESIDFLKKAVGLIAPLI